MTTRRSFIRIAGTTAVVLAAATVGLSQCDRMPEAAVAAWNGPLPGVRDPRVRALSFALLAPNPHNRQPWIADLRVPGEIIFFCDRTRLLPTTDPFSRQIMIGCGTFLELLRMAAAEQGFCAQTVTFPEGDWPANEMGEQPVCRVSFVADQGVVRDRLFAHVLQRRTNRNAFDMTPVAGADAASLGDEMRGMNVRFGWTAEPSAMIRLRDIARRAWAVEVNKDETYLESVKLFRITAPEIAHYRDGLSFHGPVFWWLNKVNLFSRETAMDDFARKQALELIETHLKTPAFAWITTSTNDRVAQLDAGAAYVRASLKATGLGLSTHPLSQALQEFPEMLPLKAEHRLALGLPESDTVQMFFRLGRAAPVEAAPRRPLDDIIRG